MPCALRFQSAAGFSDDRPSAPPPESLGGSGPNHRPVTERTTPDPSGDDPDPPIVVSVVGPSDAGKTSLIEALVGTFDDRRVGTIKSIHHDIEPDTPGADTHRHRTAGADAVIGVTPEFTFEISRGGKGSDRGDIDEQLAALRRSIERLAARGFDIVLVEGFSAAPIPSIRVGETDDSEERSGDAPDAKRIGTDEDSIETLRAAIEATEPIDPATLSRC